MGTTPFEKAVVLEWNWRCEFEGLAAIAEVLRNSSPQMKGRAMTGPRNIEQLAELAERGRMRLGHFFEDLNTRLTQSEFVAGNAYSLADITALVAVDFSAWIKASPDKSLSALWEWHGKAAARPASSA
jgi:glutathione S-transferase